MQLLNYDLYDLYALFVFLRAHPQRFAAYRQGVRQIAAHIAAPDLGVVDANSIRRCLRPCYAAEDSWLHWVLIDSEYAADVRVIRKEAYYPLLAAMLQEMLTCGDDPDRLQLLCDALHNVPLILTGEPQPLQHIQTEIGRYQDAYDPEFLRAELKRLR